MLKQLLLDIHNADIDLEVDGGSLKLISPSNTLTSDFKLRIASRKKQILALLKRTGGSVSALGIPRLIKNSSAFVVSPAQESLFFLDQLRPGNPAYNIETSADIKGRLSLERLQAALNILVTRHEALRTRFVLDNGRVTQIIEPPRPCPVEWYDIESFSDKTSDFIFAFIQNRINQIRFKLSEGFLLKLILVCHSEEIHTIHLVMHHIISDAWSLDVMFRELALLCTTEADNIADILPRLQAQPADFALQMQSRPKQQLEEHLKYWVKQLEGAPQALNLPFDQAVQTGDAGKGATLAVRLPQAVVQQLEDIGRSAGATPFMVLLALYFIELATWTGDDDIVVGTSIASRTHRHAAHMIGLFINSTPLRFRIDRSCDFLTVLDGIMAMTVSAHAHHDVPFDHLVQALPIDREAGLNPVFQTMFELQNIPATPPIFGGLEIKLQAQSHQTAKFPVSLLVQRDSEGYNCVFEYAVPSFEAATIERLANRFIRSATIIGTAPDTIVGELDSLGVAEHALATSGWASGSRKDVGDKSLFGLFLDQVAQTPYALAVKASDGDMTYAELSEAAHRVASALRSRGIGAEDVVGLGGTRRKNLLVGLLGIAAAGAAYLPIDLSYPENRISFMLGESGVRYLLVDDMPSDPSALLGTEFLSISELCQESLSKSGAVVTSARPDSLAYIIYTSGSTGTPKGVMVTNLGLTNYLLWAREAYANRRITRGIVILPIMFDAIITSLLLPVITGAYVELLPDGMEAIEALITALSEPGSVPDDYPIIKLTPAHLDMLRSLAPAAVTGKAGIFVLFGEKFNAAQVQFWNESAPSITLVNEYGPTETVVGCTAFTLDGHESEGLVPIGKPIYNIENYILDQALRPVPLGTPGELYIGGAGVARGYVGNPELTAQKFVTNPFGPPGSRMYRSGDLARWRHDGLLEFLGRGDDQLKVRGYRIEPGEIEAALLTFAEVAQAFVTALPDAAGIQSLVAYVVPATAYRLDIPGLRMALTTRLPSFLVPDSFIELAELPITSNGKVDRRALPALESSRSVGSDPPIGEAEQLLAQIWCEILGVEAIGRHDDFFILGGHSLLAVRMIATVRERLGREVPLLAAFQSKTIASFALLVAEAPRARAGRIEPAPRDRPVKLTSAQRSLWLLNMFDDVGAAYNLSGGLRLRGKLHKSALGSALDRLIDRHEALRTTIAVIDDEPAQIVKEYETMPLAEYECTADTLAETLIAEGMLPFDLSQGPLVRARLLALAPEDHVLLLSIHHIVADGISLNILLDEFLALYAAGASHSADPLEPIELQYADYAHWQNEQLLNEHFGAERDYWRTALERAPPLSTVPADFSRPAIFDPRGDYVQLCLDADLTSRLVDFARDRGATFVSVLMAAWSAIVSRHAGQSDVVIGVPSANRSHAGLESIVGLFFNTLPVRVELGEATSFAELVALQATAMATAQSHQDLPFDQIVQMLAPQRDPAFAPLFQTIFSWQPETEGSLDLPDLLVEAIASPRRLAKFDLTLLLGMVGDRIEGGVEFATALYERSTIEALAARFTVALSNFLADPDRPVVQVPIYLPGEWETLVHDWNQTEVPLKPALVHELIAAQTARTPDATMATQGNIRITYRQLDQQAARLATHLHKLGIGPDKLVAICSDRSIAMLTGLVAVLKAGGAYVPLDPSNPHERLAYMLADADPKVILVSGKPARDSIKAALAKNKASKRLPNIIDLADDHLWASLEPLSQPRPEVRPDHLAYVIYTSGSTGRPKGVMLEHRQVSNYLLWAVDGYGLQQGDRVPVNTSFAFDATVTSLLVPLVCGANILLLPEGPHELPALSSVLSERSNLGLVKLTPSHLEALRHLDPGAANDFAARCFVVGGEALSGSTADYWHRAAPAIRIINEYGPTEATVGMVVHLVTDAIVTDRDVPIGRPIANTRLYILDDDLQPTPIGMLGELFIGGAGIARGYLNQPQLTDERFISSPFVEGDRLYKTGDICRYRRDGIMEFLGRADDQVKIRGFRIELGEINARIAECAGVEQVAVVVADNLAGDKQIIAYYTAQGNCDEKGIRHHLGATLPSHMQPAFLMNIPNMPLTSNGKLDRKALPTPEMRGVKTDDYEAPQGTTEATIAEAWRAILVVNQISRHDNFFELGGHSFDAVKVVSALGRIGFEVRLQDLFAAPTVADLASIVSARTNNPEHLGHNIDSNVQPFALLENAEADRDMIMSMSKDVEDAYPLTPLQQGMLFHHLITPDHDPYILSTIFRFPDRPWIDRVVTAANGVIARHPALRSAFLWEGLSEPAQAVQRHADLAVQEVQIDTDAPDILARFQEICEAPEFGLDPRMVPLARLIIARDPAKNDWVGMWKQHHINVDHEASGLIAQEILAQIEGTPLPVALPFRNFVAEAQHQNRAEGQHMFFRAMLGDVMAPASIGGIIDVQGDDRLLEHSEYLEAGLRDRLREQARKHGVTTAALFHVAWALVLASSSDMDRIVFGTVISGRTAATATSGHIIGLLLNSLPIRIDIDQTSVGACLRRTHALLAELISHQHTSLGLAKQCSGVPSGAPLFTTLINFRRADRVSNRSTGKLPPLIEESLGAHIIGHHGGTNYPAALTVEDQGIDFQLLIETTPSIDPRQVMDMLRDALTALGEALETNPETPTEGLLAPVSRDNAHPNPTHKSLQSDLIAPVTGAQRMPEESASGSSLTHSQTLIRRIWVEVLKVDNIGLDEDFFALGGDSIRSIQVVGRALRHGIAIPVSSFFENATIRHLAAVADIATPSASEPVSGKAPLTPILHWFLEQPLSNHNRYNHAFLIQGRRRIVPDILQAAFRALIAHHDGLRLRIRGQAAGILQEIDGSDPLIALDMFDLSDLPERERQAKLSAEIARLHGSLDICDGPLTRMALFEMGPDTPQKLVWIIHHIAVDGVSWRILNDDLVACYLDLENGREWLLAPKTASVLDAAKDLDQRAETLSEVEISRWREINAQLGRNYSESGRKNPDGDDPRAIEIAFGATAWAQVIAASRRWDVSVNHLLITVMLRAIANQLEGPPSIMLEGHGRDAGCNVSRTVGWFTSMHPLVAEVGNEPIDQSVAHVAEAFSRLPEGSQSYGLTRYVRDRAHSWRDPAVLFNFHGAIEADAQASDLFSMANELADDSWSTPRAFRVEVNGGVRSGSASFTFYGADDLAERLASSFSDGVTALAAASFDGDKLGRIDTGFMADFVKPVLPLSPARSGTPLFCIHPRGGLSACYGAMARKIAAGGSVIGIQSAGFSTQGALPTNMNEVARQLLSDVCSVAPEAPYRLLGWSFGGLAALEMACQLQARGAAVEQLVLVNAYPTDPAKPRPTPTDLEVLHMVLEGIGCDVESSFGANLDRKSATDYLSQMGLLPPALEEEGVDLLMRVFRHNMHVADRFAPSSYDGDATLILPARDGDDMIHQRVQAVRPFIAGALSIRLLDCAGGDMFSPDSAAQIAAIVDEGISGIVT